MKRFLIGILASIYLVASLGATIHMHYCMGSLAGWSLTPSNQQNCDVCGMKKNASSAKPCCKHEKHSFKIADDQNTATKTFIQAPAIAILFPVYTYQLSGDKLSSITQEWPLTNSPPRSTAIAVYLSNKNFRI
jgi:hypothetical protein